VLKCLLASYPGIPLHKSSFPAVIPAQTDIQMSLKFLDSGSRFRQRRISLRLKLFASLPGMTIELCSEFQRHHTSVQSRKKRTRLESFDFQWVIYHRVI
jgi:hypothetical protein